MTRLRSGDLQSILEAVREVGRARDPDAFTRSVVQQVARLVLSDFVAVNEVDPDLGRVVYMTEPSSFTVAPEFEALLIELADVTQERAPRTEEEEEEEVLLASPPGGHSEDGTRGLWMKGQTVRMDLESATDELYAITPAEFTLARNAKASEAGKAGLADIAASLKQLRKPSVGAWLANLLVRQHSDEIDHLIQLGDRLRGSGDTQAGDEIRRVSKQKIDAVSTLIRYARSRASQSGHPASSSAIEELEMTLDAAFADPQAAAKLRQGRLTTGLRYSGLGFAAQPGTGSTARTKGSGSPRDSKSEAHRIARKRDLDEANHEAEQADGHLEKARQAVKEAAAELTRLKSEEVQAAQRSRDAHARAAAAKKGLSKGL